MARSSSMTLKERKLHEEQRERLIQTALAGRNKELEENKRARKQKKKNVSELFGLVNFCGIENKALRPFHTYVPKSYNLDKQVKGMLDHVFVQYPVPAFLYQAFQKDRKLPFYDHYEVYRQWFVTLAQGGSFPKLVKGYMTGKEAFVFLSAPPTNHIHENVWWARMKVTGLPDSIITQLIERIFSLYCFEDPDRRLAEVIQFYARYHQEMNRVTFGEVTDFLAWRLRNDRRFRLQGRTLGSVIKLTNEWHILMQKARLGQGVEWKGLQIPDWEVEIHDRVWMVVELRNNRELMNEGQKQKHCVYSYVQWCLAGRSAIFSLRGYSKQVVGYTPEGQKLWEKKDELTRVTIEVNSQHAVVQVRGPLNRLPSQEEKYILRLWAGEKGLLHHA